jgi:hypothetical protein
LLLGCRIPAYNAKYQQVVDKFAAKLEKDRAEAVAGGSASASATVAVEASAAAPEPAPAPVDSPAEDLTAAEAEAERLKVEGSVASNCQSLLHMCLMGHEFPAGCLVHQETTDCVRARSSKPWTCTPERWLWLPAGVKHTFCLQTEPQRTRA